MQPIFGADNPFHTPPHCRRHCITPGLHLPNSRVSMGDREGKEEIQRQLLPSLYEALGEDKTLACLAPALTFHRQTAPAAVFSHWTGRPRAEDAPQHPNSSSHVLATGSPPSIPLLQMEASRTELASTSKTALQKAFPDSSNVRNFPLKAGIGLILGLPNYNWYEFSDPTSTGKVTSRPNWSAAHFHNESLAVSSAGPEREILPDEPTHAWQHDKRSLSAISKLPYRPGPSTSCFTHMSNSTTANDE